MKSPDWTGRAESQRTLILERLRQAGAAGVLSKDLYDDPERRYGRSPRNRVSELKRMGFTIDKRWEGRNYRYILTAEPEKPRALPDYFAQKEIAWEHRMRVTGLPLFDLAARP